MSGYFRGWKRKPVQTPPEALGAIPGRTPMNGSFRPMRRKFGVVLLVIACGFCTARMRSLSFVDQLARLDGDFSPGYFQSVNGFLVLWSNETRGIEWDSIRNCRWNGGFRMSETRVSFFDNVDGPGRINMEWYLRWPVIGIGREVATGGPTHLVYYVAYSTITIPLAALSGWLLLSKPRSKSAVTQANAGATATNQL